MTGSNPSRRLFVYSLLILSVFYSVIFATSTVVQNKFTGFQHSSESLVIGRLVLSESVGITANSGRLGRFTHPGKTQTLNARSQTQKDLLSKTPDADEYEWEDYKSQFGLQGQAFSVLYRILPGSASARVNMLRLFCILSLAAVLSLLASRLSQLYGKPAAIGFIAVAATSSWLAAYASSLYWVAALWFLPLLCSISWAIAESNREKRWWLLGLFLTFLVRFLSGYEFTTTVIGSAMIGPLLVGSARGWSFLQQLKLGLFVGFIGIVGFVVAAGVHITVNSSIEFVLSRASNRLLTDEGQTLAQMNLNSLGENYTLQSRLRVLLAYFGSSNFDFPVRTNFMVAFSFLVCVLAWMSAKLLRLDPADLKPVRGLASVTMLSAAAPISWLFLAKGHSFIHTHMNFVLWFLPFALLGGATAGLLVSLLPKLNWKTLLKSPAAATMLLGGCALVATVILSLLDHRSTRSLHTEFLAPIATSEPLVVNEDLSLVVYHIGDNVIFKTKCDHPLTTSNLIVGRVDLVANSVKVPGQSIRLRSGSSTYCYKSLHGTFESELPLMGFQIGSGPVVWQLKRPSQPSGLPIEE